MRSFESWLFDEVEIAFGLEKCEEIEVLNSWLSTKQEIDAYEKRQLEVLQKLLKDNVHTWNEDELKMHFIGPLMVAINFYTPHYKAFTQRTLSLKTETVETSGIVDYMVATGKSRPKEPFFFLNEYKQQQPSKKNDPLGQLLIAMEAAKIKNENQHPVFGVLVEGRFWYFIVIQGDKYAISNAYNATDDDIFQIYVILRKVKDYIEEILAKQ